MLPEISHAQIQQTMHDSNPPILISSVSPSGTPDLSCPEGRIHNPGHALEAGWFLLAHGESQSNDELIAAGLKIIDISFDAGWDDVYGGLFYFLDATGRSPSPLEWDMKL